ncbi:MAG: hypothetical protein KME26_27430 [Oscillatoria princeps RMCB-10]|jgi:hypothetical protein|nr:hypothetical protein [Oscillatoria princeps RMCB-10]
MKIEALMGKMGASTGDKQENRGQEVGGASIIRARQGECISKNVMNYLTWNDLIASHFFRPEMAGRAVHLYVTEDLINELGRRDGVDKQDFIEAVKGGPPWVTGHKQGICQKALQSMENWRQHAWEYPPYIGFLALFVLAAGIEGDFSPNAYYPQLRTLIGEEPRAGQYPGFDRMRELWDDLEQWTNEDKSGDLGTFKIYIAGKRIHIGLPLAQTLLTEKERHALPAIFAEADLDPTAPPSERALADALIKQGRKHLRKRTLQLLEETRESDELRQALLERIVDDLRAWDGTAELLSGDRSKVHGFLRLCCKLDPIAERATVTLRCTTKREFPEEGLSLVLEGHSDCFSCDEAGMGWSSPIKSESNGKPLDASQSQFDWLQGFRMQDSERQWCFKLPPCPLRIFVEGSSQGLPGIVEVRQLPKGVYFYLAAHEKCCELIEQWGASGCQGFNKLPIGNGLPKGWHFFKAEAAYSDELVKDKYPVLAFPSAVRLDLQGGIRLDRGNRFFKFAPPKLVLQGGDEAVRLWANETLLEYSQVEGIYELPTDAPSGKKLVIQARKGEDVLRNCTLSLVEYFSWSKCSQPQQADKFGCRQQNADRDSDGAAGAWVRGFNPPAFNFNTFLPAQGKQRIFFVGKEPGQVAVWPEEPLPVNWLPVWAICQGRRRQALFCGTSLMESEPMPSMCENRKKLRKWKEILWHERKRTSPPTGDRRQRELWQRFQKEAERVKG